MYLDYYGLTESPFTITPNPRFVFLSERHRDGLAHLLYGIGQGGGSGFVQLTGEIGTGKTTLSRLLLEQLPERTRVALILNPQLDPIGLLEAICAELGIDATGALGNRRELTDRLNAHLLAAYAAQQRVVLIVDEAQNLSIAALEQLRLLTNLETSTQKLLQIVLIGQPELREKLEDPQLRQLAQRITARYHLTPLDAKESADYLRHRLAVAGAKRFPFDERACRLIHKRAKGIPRLLNILADRALLAGFVNERFQVGAGEVKQALRELFPATNSRARIGAIAAGIGAISAVVALGWWFWPNVRAGFAVDVPSRMPLASISPVVAPQVVLPPLSAESDHHAWQELLALWNIQDPKLDIDAIADCPENFAGKLACLRGNGNFAKLAKIDRPVLLRLVGSRAGRVVLLLGVQGDKVKLHADGRGAMWSRAAVEKAWLGEYFAVWPLPAFGSRRLKRGDVGEAVAWLHGRLAMFGSGIDASARYFGREAEQAVRMVQSRFGLLSDGVVGPETQFVLLSSSSEGPRLEKEF